MSADRARLSAQLLEEQAAYYRARAPVYDDWWEAQGADPRSEELRRAWLVERSRLEADLEEWCAGLTGASMLELAAGTGNLTRLAVRHAARVTALDASSEVLAINADKLGGERDRVEFVVADLFAWEPPTSYDAVLFGFWISHVPTAPVGAFADALVRAREPRELLVGGVLVRAGEQLNPRRGVALAGLGHARPDETLERLLDRHRVSSRRPGPRDSRSRRPLPERDTNRTGVPRAGLPLPSRAGGVSTGSRVRR